MELEELSKKCMGEMTVENIASLIRKCRDMELHNIANAFISKYKIYLIKNWNIVNELFLYQYYNNNKKTAIELYLNYLLNERFDHKSNNFENLIFNLRFIEDSCREIFEKYPEKLVQVINNQLTTPVYQKPISFVILSCKRLNLFKKTMNTFLNTSHGIGFIGEWICIDDNSSEADRREMQELYPFFKFVWKTPEQKGHAKSLNIAREMVKRPFTLLMEDDWVSLMNNNCVNVALHILQNHNDIHQVIFNRNYCHNPTHYTVGFGFETRTDHQIGDFYIHKYLQGSDYEHLLNNLPPNKKIVAHWPHFSLNPGLVKTSVLKSLGSFDENLPDFEYSYAYNYMQNGYKTAFTPVPYFIHIGKDPRSTNTNEKNAYELNDQPLPSNLYVKKQFEEKSKEKDLTSEYNLENGFSWVVTLERRPDRLEKFQENVFVPFLPLDVFNGVDGSKLTYSSKLGRMFNENDYDLREGIVGCALSHVELFKKLIYSETHNWYLILEDDATFDPEFETYFKKYIKYLDGKDWDICFLGNHISDMRRYNSMWSEEDTELKLIKDNSVFSNTMGGTHGYIISRKGAKKMMEILKVSFRNAIDTMMVKNYEKLNIYFPKKLIVFADNSSQGADSDIQYNYKSVGNVKEEDRVNLDCQYYNSIGLEFDIQDDNAVFVFEEDEEAKSVKQIYYNKLNTTMYFTKKAYNKIINIDGAWNF